MEKLVEVRQSVNKYRCDLGLKEGKPCVLAQREKL